MKKHGYNLEIITQETLNAAYASEFNTRKASTITYDLGEGVTEAYTKLHLPAGLTAILHDDINEIKVCAGPVALVRLAWTSATVELLRNIDAMSAAEALSMLAGYAVAV